MAPSFFYLALFGLCVSLVRDWEKDKDATPSSLGVKDILHSQLRRSRLWQRVREGEGHCSAGASRGGGRRRSVIGSDLYFQSLCWGLYLLYNNSCPPDSTLSV